MNDIDLDNIRLLRKGVNMLLQRACDALDENKVVANGKDAGNQQENQQNQDNTLKVFGHSAPIHTFEGSARLMAVLFHLNMKDAESSEPPFTDEDRQMVEVLLAHTQKLAIHQANLCKLPAPESK